MVVVKKLLTENTAEKTARLFSRKHRNKELKSTLKKSNKNYQRVIFWFTPWSVCC